MKNQVQILAYVTLTKERFLGGEPLALLAKTETEQTETALSLAKALKADVVQLKTGDYLILKI